MAEIPVLEAAPGHDGAGAKKKPWLLIIIIAVVVLGGGAGAAFFFLGHSDPKKDAHAKEEKAAEVKLPPIYIALDPPFVVNFEAEQLVRFLQVSVQVMTRDMETGELVKVNDPVVRNDLLLLLSNQHYDTISSAAGKEKLRGQALEAVRKVVKTAGGKPEKIENVYFTSFVMQ